jgi:hypothetical protein
MKYTKNMLCIKLVSFWQLQHTLLLSYGFTQNIFRFEEHLTNYAWNARYTHVALQVKWPTELHILNKKIEKFRHYLVKLFILKYYE